MRTFRWIACLTLGVTSLMACGEPDTAPRQVETLYLQGSGGLAALQLGSSENAYEGRGTPSPNWSTVVRTDKVVGATEVTATDPNSGEEMWSTRVPDRVRAKIVSADGDMVALGPMRENIYAYGRRSTRLMIVDRNVAEPSWIELDGNYEPEAFSTDGRSLFVIRYVPARNPTRYQVRQLDMATGDVSGVYTPHGELQQTMGGTARIQASSPDGKRLYTLYTVGRGESQHAFVHVLDLEQKWAHCVDLPHGFGRRAERASTLTVSPDGEMLYVVNINTGELAAIDTTSFQVVAADDSGFTPGTPHAATDGDTLYVTSGDYVVAFDANDLVRKWGAAVPSRARGLQVAGDGLYVGLSSEIVSLDAATGDTKEVIDPPGMKRVKQLGPVVEFEEPPPEGPIKCAC